MPTIWTKDAIREKIQTNDVMVERSLVKMLDRQTADEQMTKGTKHQNGIGFNGTDAAILTGIAQWVLNGKAKGIPEGKRLSEKQRVLVRKKLLKYAGQLAEVANEGQAKSA